MLKISVVTVSYNCSDVIEQTIQSVINQTYDNIEYIVIDGASKDGTMDAVKRYHDKISVAISEPDNGIYDAMNKGIMCATGDYVIFMNAGDSFYADDILERLCPLIKKDTLIVYGDIMKVAKRYKYLATPSPIEQMGDHMIVFHQSTLVKLEYHKQHLFDTSFRSSGDYNFFYNAYFKDNVKFQYIPLCIANFDCVDGTSNANFKRSLHEDVRIWNKENDFWFKLKLDLRLNIIALKIWIKRHLLSDEQSDKIEKRRLRKLGYKLIDE